MQTCTAASALAGDSLGCTDHTATGLRQGSAAASARTTSSSGARSGSTAHAAHAGSSASATACRRTASHATWLTLESLIRETIASLLAPLGIEHSLQYRRGVPPVVNEEVSTRILTHAIEALGPNVLADTRQSGGGEDFSWYLEEVPGAMARLGVWSGRGPQRDLHQPTFDLDERALAIGVRVLVNTVEQAAAFV